MFSALFRALNGSEHVRNDRNSLKVNQSGESFSFHKLACVGCGVGSFVLVPARVLHAKKLDPTSGVFQKKSRRFALSYGVGSAVMD